MSRRTPEEILASARRHESKAQAAESMRLNIRIGQTLVHEKVTVTERLFFRKTSRYEERELSKDEVHAIYDALATVRDQERQYATSERALVTVKENR